MSKMYQKWFMTTNPISREGLSVWFPMRSSATDAEVQYDVELPRGPPESPTAEGTPLSLRRSAHLLNTGLWGFGCRIVVVSGIGLNFPSEFNVTPCDIRAEEVRRARCQGPTPPVGGPRPPFRVSIPPS